MNESRTDPLKIAMISDFFFPNVGGVEGHIYELSQCLLKLGHKVIVITHVYGEKDNYSRQGVRYLENCLKVYHIPFRPIYNQCCLPTIYLTLPIIRHILIREKIEIVHCHSAFSALALESLMHAKTMKLKTVFTDHSLFGFADVSSILTNKLLQWAMFDADNVICVSHTSKENTVLRAYLDPAKVFVIPNAVHSSEFTPCPENRDNDYITVIVLSRLVYRKGVDFLIPIIPILCKSYSQLRFIIAGDGPKRLLLEEMREKNNLYTSVTLCGSLKHHEVRSVLTEGDIFLSTSLTEAFCIAIVEAACCGLRIVSTNVGGVGEVLPPSLINLCDPNRESILSEMKLVINEIIEERKSGGIVENQWARHREASSFYTWQDVANRTQIVYREVMEKPIIGKMERLRLLSKTSVVGGKIFAFLLLLQILLYELLCLWRPAKDILYFSEVDDAKADNNYPF